MVNKAVEFLKDSGTFFLATTEGDQPRVRPFGVAFEYEGKMYIVTNNKKKCYRQMMENPKVEISAMNKKGEWIRIAGEIKNDKRREVKEFALEFAPMLKSMYNIDDGIFATLYFQKGEATIASMKGEPQTFSL